MRTDLAARGIELDMIRVEPETRQCITVIDETAGTHTELVEESQPVSASDYQKLLEIVGSRSASAKAVIMSGSLTPGGPKDFYQCCTALSTKANALSVVDAQGEPLLHALQAKPGLVKPNRAELAASTGRALTDEAEVRSAMRELHERGAQRVVVTAGKHPALAFDGSTFWKIHAPNITAVNPIGSGDSFTAAMVWRLVQGEDLGQACRWASAAGAANALTMMAGELDRAEVERLVKQARVEKLA
jgi:tagatose 6-phosphate kinase